MYIYICVYLHAKRDIMIESSCTTLPAFINGGVVGGSEERRGNCSIYFHIFWLILWNLHDSCSFKENLIEGKCTGKID